MMAIEVGERDLSIEEVLALARGHAQVCLPASEAHRERVLASHRVLQAALEADAPIYGVNRGFGASCEVQVPSALLDQVPANLVRFHGCGVGPKLSDKESAAVLVVRLAGLARGYSGVRPALLEHLRDLINGRVLPRIPAQGSVGASGDLTPLSYVAAALMGEREVSLDGTVMSAHAALRARGLRPLALAPKESLALMNGTSVMTALACFAIEQARRLARFATSLSAMLCDVTKGNPAHFDERIFALKPHAGPQQCAAWLRADLEYDPIADRAGARLQDRYSLRCAPHVIGVLIDTLTFAERLVTTEINSVNDNPLLDPVSGRVLSGGNFYGGHVCQAMDALKTAVANIADLLDRQLAVLCEPATSGGLPADLVCEDGAGARFGFKAMQITASALAAEALKLSMPASVFSRSTERHNQDKVSMGTIAARDCLQVLGWTDVVGAVHLLALCQAVDLRPPELARMRSRLLHSQVRRWIPMVTDDRPMDSDIELLLHRLAAGGLPIGPQALGAVP